MTAALLAGTPAAGTAATSTVVIGNLLYVGGALVLMVLVILLVVARHRRPRSVEANVASFSRGLQALAPSDSSPSRARIAATKRPPVTASPGRAGVEAVTAVDEPEAAPEEEQVDEPEEGRSREAGTG